MLWIVVDRGRGRALSARGVYLHSGLGQVDAASQVLPDEGVGVVSPLKHSLQRLQLAAVEGGPVPALLPLLLLLRVHLLVWGARRGGGAEKGGGREGAADVTKYTSTLGVV